MLQGYYSAASGMRAALENQEILAQNLANAPVPGYRRQGLIFEAAMMNADGSTSSPTPSLHGTQTTGNQASFLPGVYQSTGNPTDVALDGDGFFVLDGPNGPLYTRNGQFQVNSQGQLVSSGGYPVSGTGGALNIPPNGGRIDIALDGTVSAGGTQIGQLRLASFADPKQLTRAGTTLFEAPPDVVPQTSTAFVRQGYREGSNVQVIQEMVQMIYGMRQYEAAAKALRSLSDAMQQRISAQM
jgi:flagellar basal-body rod protein FlgF